MSKGHEHKVALEARNLTCERGGRTLFSSLSFTVEGGQALVLRGANGSGKTSLLRIIAGLLTARQGDLRWGGLGGPGALEAIRENIHLIGHLTALKPVLNVRDNVAIWAQLHGGDGQVSEALETVGMSALADLPVLYLSEGQKRRTALARLIAYHKPLWLLDEPLAGLDLASAEQLKRAIQAHLLSGGMAVIATHQELHLEGSLQSVLQIGAAQ